MNFGKLFYGPDGTDQGKIVILVIAALAVFALVILYQVFIGGPKGRREESTRIAAKTLAEIVCFLARDGGGDPAARYKTVEGVLKRFSVGVTPQQLASVSAAFGYSDALFLNELSNRAAVMSPNAKHALVRATLLVALGADGSGAKDIEIARRIIKALRPLQGRTKRMAKRALAAGAASVVELAAA